MKHLFLKTIKFKIIHKKFNDDNDLAPAPPAEKGWNLVTLKITLCSTNGLVNYITPVMLTQSE